jgi:hypothetical protein
MIVHGCIEIYLNGYIGWIIEMRLRVLLITHYLIQEILVKTVFDVCHNPFLGSSQLHFLFFKKKTLKQCHFKQHYSPSSLRMQSQGRRRF